MYSSSLPLAMSVRKNLGTRVQWTCMVSLLFFRSIMETSRRRTYCSQDGTGTFHVTLIPTVSSSLDYTFQWTMWRRGGLNSSPGQHELLIISWCRDSCPCCSGVLITKKTKQAVLISDRRVGIRICSHEFLSQITRHLFPQWLCIMSHHQLFWSWLRSQASPIGSPLLFHFRVHVYTEWEQNTREAREWS